METRFSYRQKSCHWAMYKAEAGDSELSLRMHQNLEEISLAIQW